MSEAVSMSDSPAYDYIVVGAGAAGCLLANRLSRDPQHRVLLLEAGGRDESVWFRVPVGYRYTIGNPASDWCFQSQPEPGLNGRVLKHPRGKVLGGSTAINGMVVIRGQAADYDHWRSLGLLGWGWDDVLPYFKQHEHHANGASALHGHGGEWSVDKARMHWDLLDDVRDASVQAGIPPVDDFNTGDNDGVGPIHVNQRHGRRWSAADAFLKPVLQRPNLTVVTDALVDRVLFDDPVNSRRATGVSWRVNGVSHRARAEREVVLAAGAFGTPQVLMRSGIGPAADLAEHGIELRLDRPGVGSNLQDHLQIGLRFRLEGARTLNAGMNSKLAQAGMALRYALTRHGPLTMAPCQLGLFTRSSPEVAHADLGYNVLVFSRERFDAPFDPFPGLTMIVYDLRPSSRGEVKLTGADPAAPPSIRVNFLSTERDRRVAANAIRVTRHIVRQPAMARYHPQEVWAGASARDDDEDALVQAAANHGTSIFHPVGTAKMGLPSDPMAVVDASLRVIGLDGLRVVDASVMPTLISGNTATPTVMIAEKGAEMILRGPAARAATVAAPHLETTP
jgi:choline dehydrogenase-like flavoprotein